MPLHYRKIEGITMKKTGMAETIEQGHYVATPGPKIGKGTFDQVGTFIDEG